MLHQVYSIVCCVENSCYISRTDFSGEHINGQGNYGFCGRPCGVNELGQRINLAAGDDITNNAVIFPDDNLPDTDVEFVVSPSK